MHSFLLFADRQEFQYSVCIDSVLTFITKFHTFVIVIRENQNEFKVKVYIGSNMSSVPNTKETNPVTRAHLQSQLYT